MRYEEKQAKTILTASGIAGIDYVINPYIGCQFACQYCYAVYMGNSVGESLHSWGSYVYAKVNAVELLKKELDRVYRKRRNVLPHIMLSTSTDPYQPAEKKYRLTRGLLEVLAKREYEGEVSILTKSPLVLRDLDVLQQLPNLSVGITITPGKAHGAAVFEPHAPSVESRLAALDELGAAGIRTYAFIAPVLSRLCCYEELLEEVFSRISQAGAEFIITDLMNTRGQIAERLRYSSAVNPQFWRDLGNQDYKLRTKALMTKFRKKYGLRTQREIVRVRTQTEKYRQLGLFD